MHHEVEHHWARLPEFRLGIHDFDPLRCECVCLLTGIFINDNCWAVAVIGQKAGTWRNVQCQVQGETVRVAKNSFYKPLDSDGKDVNTHNVVSSSAAHLFNLNAQLTFHFIRPKNILKIPVLDRGIVLCWRIGVNPSIFNPLIEH